MRLSLFYLKILIGLSFIGFGIWTLRGDTCGGKEKKGNKLGPILTGAIAFFLANLVINPVSNDCRSISFIPGSKFRIDILAWFLCGCRCAIVVGIIAGKNFLRN